MTVESQNLEKVISELKSGKLSIAKAHVLVTAQNTQNIFDLLETVNGLVKVVEDQQKRLDKLTGIKK